MTADSDHQAYPFSPLIREEELRLWPLAVHARYLLQNLRYVDYVQAEADAALLAQKIRSLYPRDELRKAAFTPIPRGGLVVLGLLAYQLDLRPEQLLAGAAGKASQIFLVDDCALSGSRLQGTLPLFDGRPVAVVHLYSAPGLRTAVRAAFPNVTSCLAAHDLMENENAGPVSGRLHPGPTELVAFAWNEPDLLVQTPFEKRPAHQWRFLSPHKCLNNRQALGLPPAPPARREWIVPDGLVYGWFDGVLYLLDTRSETVFRLDNFAADCWRAAAGYGNRDAALAFLQDQYPQLTAFVIVQQLEQTLLQFRIKKLLNNLAT
jgi:hypothetical protein